MRKNLLDDWLKFRSWKVYANKTLKMCWANCLKPRIELPGVACRIINWVRISCSYLKRIV